MNRAFAIAFVIAPCVIASPSQAQQSGMTFFVAAGQGNGADLGGLRGADERCQSLAKQAGASAKTWRAYLSTGASGAEPAVNARERIGRGPWRNAKGVVVAKDLTDLHANPNINKETALTEKGATVNGRGDTPNMHDILTGSTPDGRAFPPDKGDMTCRNWTSSGEGAAMVGHHDRVGLRDDDASRSWNSSHPSRGCSQQALVSTGGAGYFYCFAAD
jgi:hypothetical protein